MTQQPSAAAPSLALPSSSLPSHSAPPAEPLVIIAYDLRDGSNANVSLTPPSVVRLHPSALIIDLQQAVFNANANKLRGGDYTDLDVYPPGSTDWTDRSTAADAEDDIARLLPGPDITDRRRRRFVVIARPLPSFGGARGSAVKLQTTSVPEHVRAVVGRVCRGNEVREEKDFVARTVGTGVWFGEGGVVLTAYHVVKGLNPLFFYLYDRRAGVWVRRRMRVAAQHEEWDIAVLQQEGRAKEEGEGRGSYSDYRPQLLEMLWPQPDADAWGIGFPQIIDRTLIPPPVRSSDSDLASTASSSTADSSPASMSSQSLSLSSSSSSSSSSSTPASSSSSPSSSTDEKAEASSTFPSASSSSLISGSTSSPTSSLVEWQPQSPAVSRGVISKAGYESVRHVADYIAAPNSSGGAVVGESEAGDWYLLGIHLGVVHHDIDHKKRLEERLEQAAGTSAFSEFIAINHIQLWLGTALRPNAQVFNSTFSRKERKPIVGQKRTRPSATAQSAGAAADADEGEGEGEDELVYVVDEGWDGYYSRRLPPVPLPARPRTQSDPTPSQAAAGRPAGGGTTGGRETRSL